MFYIYYSKTAVRGCFCWCKVLLQKYLDDTDHTEKHKNVIMETNFDVNYVLPLCS